MSYEINNSFKVQFSMLPEEDSRIVTLKTKNHWVIDATIKIFGSYTPLQKPTWDFVRNSNWDKIYAIWEITVPNEMYPKSIIINNAKIVDGKAVPTDSEKDPYFSITLLQRYKDEETDSWKRTLRGTFSRISPKKFADQDKLIPNGKYYQLALKEALPSYSKEEFKDPMDNSMFDDEVFGDEPTTTEAKPTTEPVDWDW